MRSVFGLAVFIALLTLAMGQGDTPSQPAPSETTPTLDFPWAVFAVPSLMHYPLVDFADWQRHQPEIQKRIADLGNGDFKVREAAMKRLREIGVPGLAALYKAEENGEVEVRKRAAMLVQTIRIANRLPTRVDGMEFELIVNDKVWQIPKEGRETSFHINVRLSNVANRDKRLHVFAELDLSLKDSKGTEYMRGGGTERSMRNPFNTDALSLGESLTRQWKCRMLWSKGRPTLVCQSESSHWKEAIISKGIYSLCVTYSTSNENSKESIPFWIGKAETLSDTIVIK
jgi:hypothetical protein